ncbi:hypothetical protein [Simiduia agarivorans]|uniref:Uncharacterized protein n=1 Tax=Simiduia agarivorans (strain DSM 21679 / JCM 13881 / BCRC 17597 / SA1) TaxID=1117647 RepID=K4KKN0_SIMAS|nr:hypothetical protein [Simiduia agarivorans]AFU99684.1 hypothetical protein M5M_12660 [Simiduia agarivorans SA1 = DSM 21679]
MSHHADFTAYVSDLLHRLLRARGYVVSEQKKFNATTLYAGDVPVALILRGSLYVGLSAARAALLLPGTRPLNPEGVHLDSHYYPVPLAWLCDPDKLAQCMPPAMQSVRDVPLAV